MTSFTSCLPALRLVAAMALAAGLQAVLQALAALRQGHHPGRCAGLGEHLL